MLDLVLSQMKALLGLGGPVVMLLLVVSVLTLAVVLYKLWQLSVARVGSHTALRSAVRAWDAGRRSDAREALSLSQSYLVPIVSATFDGGEKERLQAMAEERFAALERGFRFLDSVAQLAPLLGLFGTVLAMIQAFQSMQEAGAQVDPSLLAGGIWVALLTTAVGLAVAMPTAFILAWFEGRMNAERVAADTFILTALSPTGSAESAPEPGMVPRHG
ncbi:MAG: MotA/TolQ/ExbB proton channel family protein [Tateyamaria sp.]|jgi:biopolymer transport protein ExbB|uniref:MotA/TolQ/ExbB proton channel family protein n=1 Tax=Tateyamaria sp. TaxID=1929288 RepID=UPI0032DD8503